MQYAAKKRSCKGRNKCRWFDKSNVLLYCYENGKFKQANASAEQMQEFVKGKMKEMGFPSFLAGFFTKAIPKLERWKK